MDIPQTVGTALGPTVDGASAALLSELLRELERELVLQGIPTSDFLNPGVDESTVRTAFESCNLDAPDEVVSWFSWHNGPSLAQGADDVMPMFIGWTLEDCVRAYLNPKGQPKGHEDWQWNPDWIQIMGDANGLAVCCAGALDAPPLVRGLSWDDPGATQVELHLKQVVSLCTPVAWWIDALQHGWYRWNRELLGWESPLSAEQPFMRFAHGLS